MEEVYKTSQASLLVYTRRTVPGIYPDGLARSIHLAYSRDGIHYQSLNRNYGILFAAATIGADDTIRAKGMKHPWVFPMADGKFGLVAVRVNEDGSADEESRGKVLLWTTDNFIEFQEKGLLNLGRDTDVEEVQCSYDPEQENYRIIWQDRLGNSYENSTADLCEPSDMSAPVPADAPERRAALQVPEGAVAGNTVALSSNLCDRIVLHWSSIYNTAVRVPERITAAADTDVASVQAEAVYSDGSTALKQVCWDTASIDFSRPGVYQVSGTVENEQYLFPLDRGFGDPVIFHWQGKYYFAATNDNTKGIGLYVRASDNVAGLFKEGTAQHLILDVDEERGLIKTFWAPEFHVIGGELYLFFAVSGKVWGPQCYLMRLKKGGSICNPDSWEDPVRVRRKNGKMLAEDGISLDMTYLKAGGRSYVIWSYRRNTGTEQDTGSMLYIATVDEGAPWQLTSEPVLLSRPLYGWENVNHTINNEGPCAFVTGNRVYLTYSGGASDSYTYALGLFSAKPEDDLLDPSNWEKRTTPVLSFYSVEGEYGPGHNSFFTDAHGNLMIAYHAEFGMEHQSRCVGIRRVHFTIKEQPVFDLSADRDLHPHVRQVKMEVIVGGQIQEKK